MILSPTLMMGHKLTRMTQVTPMIVVVLMTLIVTIVTLPVRTVFFVYIIIRWTRGGGGRVFALPTAWASAFARAVFSAGVLESILRGLKV